MQKQSNELKESLTKNILDPMDEKPTPMIEENEKMKQKICNLEKEIEYFKTEKNTNNIVLYGLEESEKSTLELLNIVKETFKRNLNLSVEENEVNRIYRLGKNRIENKNTPVLLSFIYKQVEKTPNYVK